MDTLTSIRVFTTVADLKSFSAAADKLSLSPAMATKHVQHLEEKVGARLLNRTSRSVSLTEAGVRYLDRARALVEGLDDIESELGETTLTPRGVLKVSLPVWMANPGFAKIIAAYSKRYPQVRLDLDLEGRMVNLVTEGFDLALRATFRPEEGLISRKLADVQFHLVAAPAFLEHHGRPKRIADLEGKPFLAYSQVVSNGQVRLGEGDEARMVQFDPVLQTTNETLLLLAAKEAMGFSMMPKPMVEEELKAKRLERVLAASVNPAAPLYAVYPNRSYLPAKVRSFLDFMVKVGSIGWNPEGLDDSLNATSFESNAAKRRAPRRR